MSLRNMTTTELAEATGFKRSTIYAFFANLGNRDKSENVAKAISKVLNVEIWKLLFAVNYIFAIKKPPWKVEFQKVANKKRFIS